MDSSDLIATLVLGLLWIRRRRRRRKSRRTLWVKPIFTKRKQQGEYHNLLQEMRRSDPEGHFRYLRMSKDRFDSLLSKVGPLLTHRTYGCTERPSINPAERLALTIRYLATGNLQVSMSLNFRIGRSSVCTILQETCEAIWTALGSEFVKAPSCEEDWKRISRDFEQKWNFPNCIGALDGKHIVIQAPVNSGSLYFNYKGTHSIVLMALCDAHYRFTLVDVGQVGRHSDGGVLFSSDFGQALEDNTLFLPAPRILAGTTGTGPEMPFVIVADEAFPLRTYMMRPYPGCNLEEKKAVFNYRLSRARRIIFGILAARWRLFRRPIIAQPSSVIAFTKACIALHNYLRTTESSVYCPAGFVDGEDGTGNVIEGSWRTDEEQCTGLEPVSQTSSNRYSRCAATVRDEFRDYFCTTDGELSWQYTYVKRT